MIRALLRNAGFRRGDLMRSLSGWLRYARDRRKFREQIDFAEWPWGDELPMLNEWNEDAGTLGAYFLQDQWVARQIFAAEPERHVDIGSRIDGFIGHLAVFREVDVIDLRPLPQSIANVRFHQLDLQRPLADDWRGATDSLSCLHALEHFGLGRYGDPIDPDGHIKGLAQLMTMLRPGGMLYLSVPIGPQRVEFNAHRVFAPETMLGWFEDDWRIEKCAVIDDCDYLWEGDRQWLGQFDGRLGVGIVAARKLR